MTYEHLMVEDLMPWDHLALDDGKPLSHEEEIRNGHRDDAPTKVAPRGRKAAADQVWRHDGLGGRD